MAAASRNSEEAEKKWSSAARGEAPTSQGGVGEAKMMISREISPTGKQRQQWKDDAAASVAAAGSCGLGYVSFLCIGFNSLVNWIFVMQTLPFIAKTQLEGEDWNNSLLGLFQAVEVVVLLCMLRLGSTSVLGVCTAGLVNAAAAILFPLLTVTNFSGRQLKVIMLHLLCLLLGSCSAVLQGSGFALAAVMPKNFVGAVSAGQGLAGAFTFAVVTGASFLLFNIETVKGTQGIVWLVFSIAAVTSVACTALFFSAMKQTWAAAALREVALAAARRKCSEEEKQEEQIGGREESEEEKLITQSKKLESACDEVALHSNCAAADATVLKTGSLFPAASSSSASTLLSNTAVEVKPCRDGSMNGKETEKREARQPLESRSYSTTSPAESTTAVAAATGTRASQNEGRERGDAQGLVSKLQLQKEQQQYDITDLEQQEEKSGACAQEKVTPRLTGWKVLKQAAPWLCVLMMHMAITFHLYPKVGPLSWHYNKPLVKNHLVVLFGLFCAAESIGRFLPDLRSFRWPWGGCKCSCSSKAGSSASTSGSSSSSHRNDGGNETNKNGSSNKGSFSWLVLSRRALVVSELARLLLFVPFVLGYALSDVPFINSFGWYCCLIIILALTQGWMGTLAFFYSVTSVDDTEAKKFTGPMAAIASPLGCVIGLYTAAPY